MTTSYPTGVNNTKEGTFRDYIEMSPAKLHTYFEDFDYYRAGDWTLSGAGTSTEALTNVDGGRLLITNAASDNNASFLNKVGESFLFETGKKIWFEALFQVSDGTQSDIVCGLQITDTTPLDVSDGVFFIKADGADTVNFVVEKNGTATTTSNVASIGDDTDISLGFYYDGKETITIFSNGVAVARSNVDNLPDDEVLTISFGIQNGEAVAKTMSMDYVFVAKER